MSALRKWAEEHSEGGVELASWHGNKWEFSAWLDWTRFGFGFDVEREYGSPSWSDRLHIVATLGPVAFAAIRIWNDPDAMRRTRVIPPGVGV